MMTPSALCWRWKNTSFGTFRSLIIQDDWWGSFLRQTFRSACRGQCGWYAAWGRPPNNFDLKPGSDNQSMRKGGRLRRRDCASSLIEVSAYFWRHVSPQQRLPRLPLFRRSHLDKKANLLRFHERDWHTVAIKNSIRCRW